MLLKGRLELTEGFLIPVLSRKLSLLRTKLVDGVLAGNGLGNKSVEISGAVTPVLGPSVRSDNREDTQRHAIDLFNGLVMRLQLTNHLVVERRISQRTNDLVVGSGSEAEGAVEGVGNFLSTLLGSDRQTIDNIPMHAFDA